MQIGAGEGDAAGWSAGPVGGVEARISGDGSRALPHAPHVLGDSVHPSEPLVTPTTQRRGYRVTPAVTRSRAAEVLRSGAAATGFPGAFALLAAEEDMLHKMNTTHVSDLLPPDKPVTEMPTPETDAEAYSCPFRRLWAGARQKEIAGLGAAGTFVELAPGE